MGKTNVITVLAVTILQVLIGYFWYSPHLFGDIMTSIGGHGVNYLKTDILSLLLLIVSSYGLTHVFDAFKVTGIKDSIKLGLTIGGFAIGLPVITLMNLLGFGKIVLLVVFCHMVLVGVLTSVVLTKLKKI